MVVDTLFLFAVLAFGFGLSLATYRVFAVRNGWPMGEVQAEVPLIAVLIGVAGVAIAFLFALARSDVGGWLIPIIGMVAALLWTGVLRVGSQMSLFLAPVATGLLLLGWAQVNWPGTDRDVVPSRTLFERPKASITLPFSPLAEAARADQKPTGTGQEQVGPRLAFEVRDARGRVEVLPGAPSGLLRPIDPARVVDPAVTFRPAATKPVRVSE